MGLLESFLIAVGLSADAFAISLVKGLGMRRIDYGKCAVIALFFGGSQALMPLIGALIGAQFSQCITRFGHFIAFFLLSFIGAKMIYESIKNEPAFIKSSFDLKELLILSLATSIDAFTIGMTFAFIKTPVLPAASVIGLTAFALSFLGVISGVRFGAMFKRPSEMIGGAVLIFIGLKMMFEHTGLISFL
ncbi:MAG: manganese efflux pump [Clostridia bacterium]|nr:manganese efflux pump [Clostridia bacterium]